MKMCPKTLHPVLSSKEHIGSTWKYGICSGGPLTSPIQVNAQKGTRVAQTNPAENLEDCHKPETHEDPCLSSCQSS